VNEMKLGGGMSSAFDYHSGVNPLTFQDGGRVPTIHGYPYLWKLRWEFTSISLILFQACVKMKPILSLVFVISRARKYMRIGYLS
jgi:hypothetical protein